MNNYSINNRSLLILRVSLSGIFVIAGINHLLFTENVLNRLMTASMSEYIITWAPAELLVISSGFFMLVGGLTLMLGFKTKWTAIGLILIVLPITLTIQVGQWATAGPLFKNIVIIGGLLFFTFNGALCCSVDQLLSKHLNTK